MSAEHLPYLLAAWVLLTGLAGIVTSRDLVHTIMCLAVLQTSVHVLLLAIGYRHDATAPIYDDVPADVAVVDPVVQALTVTDIVVGAAATALLLAFAVQVNKRTGSLDPAGLVALRG
ncbi:MAG TPA: NADH-quinone oxidoreductase subunit K [Egibacteraceae bacterium]|jgi:multicomponent Na+:H+ antiporter subunit C|nr:NADH-quinone oxidoreductase subunit K [Egibacteraceae bacterium]